MPDYLDRLVRRSVAEVSASAEAHASATDTILDIAEESGSESAIKDHVTGANGDRHAPGAHG